MDPLEIYAKARDGGPWFQLAAETWDLIAAILLLMSTIILVILLSAKEKSFASRLWRALRPPHADNLFMRVGVTSGQMSGQAYLASMATHQVRLYSKFPMEPGTSILIDPPGVQMIVQAMRPISADPPWFAIEGEPLFRDDVTRRNYRKFLGELSQVA